MLKKALIIFVCFLLCSKFIKDKYGYDDDSPVPSYFAGAVYDVSLVISPFLGIIIVSLLSYYASGVSKPLQGV